MLLIIDDYACFFIDFLISFNRSLLSDVIFCFTLNLYLFIFVLLYSIASVKFCLRIILLVELPYLDSGTTHLKVIFCFDSVAIFIRSFTCLKCRRTWRLQVCLRRFLRQGLFLLIVYLIHSLVNRL